MWVGKYIRGATCANHIYPHLTTSHHIDLFRLTTNAFHGKQEKNAMIARLTLAADFQKSLCNVKFHA